MEEVNTSTSAGRFGGKELLAGKENIVVVDIPLDQVIEFESDPAEFKEFFLNRFPYTDFFETDSKYAFRGARIRESVTKEIQDNLVNGGVEFRSDSDRPPGIYLQPGERPDSYERSVHFAFGKNYPSDGDFFVEPKTGDVGVFSVYQIKDGEEYQVSPESAVYPGEGASNKKYVPQDKEKTWKDLRKATIVFKIV